MLLKTKENDCQWYSGCSDLEYQCSEVTPREVGDDMASIVKVLNVRKGRIVEMTFMGRTLPYQMGCNEGIARSLETEGNQRRIA